jgi:hypothetical protein
MVSVSTYFAAAALEFPIAGYNFFSHNFHNEPMKWATILSLLLYEAVQDAGHDRWTV